MDDGRRDGTPRGKSLGSWKSLVPLSLAAGAALFIGGSVDVVHRHQRAADDEHEAKPASKSVRTEPRFVVGVVKAGTALIVRDLHTGVDVGIPAAAPQGRRFQRVAAAKDGSYVVASYGDHKVTFQRLRLDDDGRPKDFKDIPKAAVPGDSTAWSDLAVSPDGEHIAYVTYKRARGRVDVVAAGTGVHKVWTTKVPARFGSLSWSGATLSFVWSPVTSVRGRLKETRHQVRTLDTNGAAGDLKVSKAVMTLPKGSSTAVLSRDGGTVVAGIVKGSQLTLQPFTLDGRPAKALWNQKVKGELSGLDTAHTGKGFLATAGDLYAQGVPPIPGQDLADAAW